MRILGNIDHPQLKITVFKMDNRLSVKLETGLYEQIYKFRDGEGIDQLEDVKALLDEPFFAAAFQGFQNMHALRMATVARNGNAEEEEFETII